VNADRPPVRVSGSVELHLDQVAERLAVLLADELERRGVGIVGGRGEPYNPNIDHHAPPRYGEHDAGQK
jgi:hypothetical protein